MTNFRPTSAKLRTSLLYNGIALCCANLLYRRFFVVKYREILRLHAQGVSQRGIASSCANSRNTIREVDKRAQKLNISWPFQEDMTDSDLQELLFPESMKHLISGENQIVSTSIRN